MTANAKCQTVYKKVERLLCLSGIWWAARWGGVIKKGIFKCLMHLESGPVGGCVFEGSSWAKFVVTRCRHTISFCTETLHFSLCTWNKVRVKSLLHEQKLNFSCQLSTCSYKLHLCYPNKNHDTNKGQKISNFSCFLTYSQTELGTYFKYIFKHSTHSKEKRLFYASASRWPLCSQLPTFWRLQLPTDLNIYRPQKSTQYQKYEQIRMSSLHVNPTWYIHTFNKSLNKREEMHWVVVRKKVVEFCIVSCLDFGAYHWLQPKLV